MKATAAMNARLLSDARDGLGVYRQAFGRDVWGLVLDIGAHHGAFALEAYRAGAASVVCIEASAANYEVLLRNVRAADPMFPSGCFRAIYAAAYESSALTVALRKTAGDNTGQHSVEFDERYAISDRAVPVIPFTELLGRAWWTYVKIDVEGAEWSLLNRGETAIPVLMDGVAFLDLELHPLDNADYYAPRDVVYHLPDVVDWFRKHGHRVATLDAHPTRIFVCKGA